MRTEQFSREASPGLLCINETHEQPADGLDVPAMKGVTLTRTVNLGRIDEL